MNLKKLFNEISNYSSLFLFIVLMIGLSANFSEAIQVVGDQGIDCRDLIAGQTIDAGDVCAEVMGENLVITYYTDNGWQLTEAHLWVGLDLANMPQTKKGNPQIGNFPYNSGDITGSTSFYFSVPLAVLGSEEELCNADKMIYIAAHAAVIKDNGGGVIQSETGWGSGVRIVEKGSWATYYTIQFSCDITEPVVVKDCETAFAFGDKKLWDIYDINGDPITNRWGWQITVYSGNSLVTPIYAGAGQNDITKGTYVGDLYVSYDGSIVEVKFVMFDSFTMDETHLYVGSVNTSTAAPGQFGNQKDLTNASSDSYSIVISSDPIYIVAHAVVCM